MSLKLPKLEHLVRSLTLARQAGITEIFVLIDERGCAVMPSSKFNKHSFLGEAIYSGYYPLVAKAGCFDLDYDLKAMGESILEALKAKVPNP